MCVMFGLYTRPTSLPPQNTTYIHCLPVQYFLVCVALFLMMIMVVD